MDPDLEIADLDPTIEENAVTVSAQTFNRFKPGMRIRISLVPDSTCHNGFIKLFSSFTKYKPESTNSSLK